MVCREMPRDLVPALTLVEAGKHRAAIGPEVEPHRFAFVTRHGLPKNGEVAGFLWHPSRMACQVLPPPDLILSHNTPTTAALLQQTRTIPIIFFVASVPR